MARKVDLPVGWKQSNGRLTISEILEERDKHGNRQCMCICSKEDKICGPYRISDIKNEVIKSCGCYQLERVTEANTTHGKCYSFEYSCWSNMIQRCTNPNHEDWNLYGGNNPPILVYEEWKKFEVFYAYMKDCPEDKSSINRINGKLGYVPGNVEWSDSYEQNNNKTNNREIEYNGRKLNLFQWSRELNTDPCNIAYRMKQVGLGKMTLEDVFNKPYRKYKKRKSMGN